MKAPEDLQPGFVLHSRRYRESSLIVDLFSRDYGIIPAVARGVRAGKSNHKRALLQPFQPIQCRWRGQGEMVTLTDIDSLIQAPKLSKQGLYCGFYINEILLRLLHRHDPYETIFALYQKLLFELTLETNLEHLLREFELTLLDELGYGLSFSIDAEGEDIAVDGRYYLSKDSQFHPVIQGNREIPTSDAFQGRILLDIQNHKWHDPEVLKSTKKLIRMVLQPLIGTKPLQSRKLFRSLLND